MNMLSIAIPVLVFFTANAAIFFTGNSGSNLLFYLLFGTASIALYYLVFMAVLHFIPNTLFDKITIVQWSPYVKKVAISALLPLLMLTALTIYAPFEKSSGFVNLKWIDLFIYPGGLPGSILLDEYKVYLRKKEKENMVARFENNKCDTPQIQLGSALYFTGVINNLPVRIITWGGEFEFDRMASKPEGVVVYEDKSVCPMALILDPDNFSSNLWVAEAPKENGIGSYSLVGTLCGNPSEEISRYESSVSICSRDYDYGEEGVIVSDVQFKLIKTEEFDISQYLNKTISLQKEDTVIQQKKDAVIQQKADAIISGPAVVFVLPSTESLKEMENKYGEDFYPLADDAMFYQNQAIIFLKDKGVRVLIFNPKDVLRFKLSSGEFVEEDLSKLPYWNGLLFNGIEKPIIVDFILIKNDYNRYMINTNKTNPQAVSNDNPSVNKFLGSWIWESNDKSAGWGFDLKQGSDPNSVHGTMCGSFYFGNKSDCDPYNEDALIGILNGNILNLKFISTWGGNGEATLISNPNGSVSWEITKKPTDYYLPESATLVPER